MGKAAVIGFFPPTTEHLPPTPAPIKNNIADICPWLGVQHDTIYYFKVRSKADINQLNLPHGTNN